MYNPYFGFSCSPFENTLDQRFLFLSESHEEVIAALLYFVQEKKSFALVCGDVGTGKTMIVHHVLSSLHPSVQPILIPYPDVEYIEILRYIARVLKINPEGKGILDLTDEVKAVLTKPSLDGKQYVLIIDEAHLLPVSSLENIRLLSNIELIENKLLQILLIGQNELSYKLRRRDMRQLRQRINVNRFLSPMSPSDTIEYIDHRLGVAGSGFDRCFDPSCKKPIYKLTGGVPRSINRLCDTALLVCMSQKADKVTGRIVKKAHDALHSDVILAPKAIKPGRFFGDKKFSDKKIGAEKFSDKKLKPALAGGALVLLLALVFFGYRGKLRENLKGWMDGSGPPKAVNTLVQKPLPPDSGVKSEEVPKPPEAEEKSASSNMPGLVTPQTPGPAQESPEAVPKEGEMKIDTASPYIEEPSVKEPLVAEPPVEGPSAEKPFVGGGELNPAPSGESPANGRNWNADLESTQSRSENADEKITAKGGNPNGDVQDLRTRAEALGPSDFFTVTVKKGESLRKIAARWFPEDPASGEKSILSANPRIHDKNRILAGQILRIPGHKLGD
jgi:type II secretory pathway predicted ATPase ExeA